MQIAVTGSTGLVGSALVPALRARGETVVRLVRRAPRADDEVEWDPDSGLAHPARLDGLDAVVHLAGENIGGRRWTAAQKERIRQSRTRGTATLVRDLLSLPAPPSAFVSASAIGFYGATGSAAVDESAPPGEGFLPEVCRAWEDASEPLADRGARVAHMRFGVILSAAGGALAKMLTPFRLGLGGVIGSGQQGMSWVTRRDVIGALLHTLDRGELSGPVNVTAPGACTNREFTRSLGKALGRPTIFPLPAFAARLAFGEMADDLLLASAWVRPRVLTESGYRFQDPEIAAALQRILA